MTTDTRSQLADVKAKWDYSDVIALVVANLDGTQFNGDRARWMRGLCVLSEQYPTLLRGVRFRLREPFTPYSREADEVLKMLGKWEYRGDFNPRFRRIEISEEGKEELRSQLAPKLSEHTQEIVAMAKILSQYVAPSTMPDDTARQPTG